MSDRRERQKETTDAFRKGRDKIVFNSDKPKGDTMSMQKQAPSQQPMQKRKPVKLQPINKVRLVPVSAHAAGELPEGLEEAAERFKPTAVTNVVLYRIADTQCYVWAVGQAYLSPVLVVKPEDVVAML